jgi:hypothetical protein
MTGFLAGGAGLNADQGDKMTKLALLGDSIFDNGAYVGPGEEVISYVNADIPADRQAVLLAQDGAVIDDIADQLKRLPADSTHLAISVGGNDALRSTAVLAAHVSSVSQALLILGDVREAFAAKYRAMLEEVSRCEIPTMLCTIYDVHFADPLQRRASTVALGILNDLILREATVRRLPVIDLRVIFTEGGDYANAIEPSGQGAAKIARVMAEVIRSHDFQGPGSLYGPMPA